MDAAEETIRMRSIDQLLVELPLLRQLKAQIMGLTHVCLLR